MIVLALVYRWAVQYIRRLKMASFEWKWGPALWCWSLGQEEHRSKTSQSMVVLIKRNMLNIILVVSHLNFDSSMFSLHQLEFTCLKEDTLKEYESGGDDGFIAFHRRSLSGLSYKKVVQILVIFLICKF